MAMKSTTYYEQTEDMYSMLGTPQAVDIGYHRPIIVEADGKGLTFFTGVPKIYKIRLNPEAVNVMNSFIHQIRDCVNLLKSDKLQEKFCLPLGARIFLEIDPKVKCVSIRRFFRPKPNPTVLLPGSNGIGLKLQEFELLDQHWNQLIKSFLLGDEECCYFTDPREHTTCEYCWN